MVRRLLCQAKQTKMLGYLVLLGGGGGGDFFFGGGGGKRNLYSETTDIIMLHLRTKFFIMPASVSR